MKNSKGKHVPMESQTLGKRGWGLMERSFLLCSVSRQQMGGSWVFEMRPPFISNKVASVVGIKAKELLFRAYLYLSVTGKHMLKYSPPRRGTVVTYQMGAGLILDRVAPVFRCLSLAPPASQYLWLHPVHFKTLCWFPWKIPCNSWEHCRMFI